MSLSLFVRFVQLRLAERLEHRGAFLIGMLAQMLGWSSEYCLVYLLAKRFDSLNGWTWPQLALLFSIELLSYAVGASFLYSPMMELEDMVRDGTFDQVLTRPTNPLLYLVAAKYNVGYLAHVILSTAMLVWSLGQLSLHWTPWLALYLVATLIGAACLQAAMLLVIGSRALTSVRFAQAFRLYFTLKDFISYPLTIYPLFVQHLLTLLVPIAFINFVPAAQLLSKPNVTGTESIGWLSPLVGPLVLYGAYRLFTAGLRRYQSAGG